MRIFSKKHMYTSIKTIGLSIFLGLVMLTSFHQPVVAADALDNLTGTGSDLDLADEDLTEVIATVINIFLSILGIILLVIIIYAGFLWMTAGGNSDQVAKAKSWMINAVIGLVLIAAAYSITFFVIDRLTDEGLLN